MRYSIVASALLLTGMISCSVPTPPAPAIIPKPVEMTVQEGGFKLNSQTVIFISGDQLSEQADYLASRIRTASGLELKTVNKDGARAIRLILEDLSGLITSSEGYTLVSDKSGVTIRATAPAGIFYGIQTLFQLMPPAIYSSQASGGASWILPLVSIKDEPRFEWRGYMLDVSRHFFPMEHLYRVVDQMAMHKLNRFHLHLTDDQGWRIEIKKYPKLTDVGAWRVDRESQHWNSREPQKPGEQATYGGFYTQDQILSLVQYAAKQNIQIVPEIEMPAHATAGLAAYPEYSCTGEPLYVLPGGIWPCNNIFCAGKDETFQFLQDIIDEVIGLFPYEYIHIGGDEADKTKWKECPLCQSRMKKEGLKDERELQSYFIKRMEVYLNSKGKNLIGWDEILEGGLAPNAAVMSWRGTEGGIQAAKSSHKVVMSPTSHCYFDYYQGAPETEPLAIGGYLPLDKVYSFEPVPEELTAEEGKWIIGAQANLWTEYVPNPSHADYMTYPRLAALSELCWTPAAAKDFADFSNRLKNQVSRYQAAGINYATSFGAVMITTRYNEQSNQVEIELTPGMPGCAIRYSLDGSDPVEKGTDYSGPFAVNSTATVKAIAMSEGKPFSGISEKKIWLHLATGRKITYDKPFSTKYPGSGNTTLINSIRGSVNYSDGCWQGFDGNDLDCTIDLGSPVTVTKVSLGTLQSVGAWIFFPVSVEVFTAADDGSFQTRGAVQNTISTSDPERKVQDLTVSFEPSKARFVKVVARNLGTCPPGHAGAGSNSWMFVDEIIVE
jgi:hexosaminidase